MAVLTPTPSADMEKGLPLEASSPSPPSSYAAKKYDGLRGRAVRTMDFLVEHGVEERGIQPRPEDEREPLGWRSYLPQLAFWAAMNTNILTFSEGMIGILKFRLDFKSAVLVIVIFTFVMCLPAAWLATNGPRTGMRQMVQARYAMGYFPTIIIGLANCITFVGYLSLQSILGGQCLSIASEADMSWTVGIVVVTVICVCLSFIGLRALHILSLTTLPVIFLVYLVLVGVNGDKLHFALNDAAQAASKVTAWGILGYGATQIGFTASYAGMASDFSTLLPANTPRLPLFCCVYFGLALPIIVLQIFGAACALAARSIPAWDTAAQIGAPNLVFTMFGAGGPAKFVMVLFCFSVTANVAPTIYSCGLSGQVVFPFLVRVPRYFLAIIVTAIYLPVAIVGSTHFFTMMLNFLGVLGYWTSLYLPPALVEPILFRNPVNSITYPVDAWNKPSKLPWGLAFVISAACAVPVCAAGMSQTWWKGWIARKIEGSGDLGFELGFMVVLILFIPLRYMERKWSGR
ncbi:putative cytosine-purine permease [Cutaneotrichosporon oleaginosum]|uniref:Putative cytosine-purine permease n=1 Tax=Cutaneotrichosporon oleaginosum TaxID=879819 RepID=A0A0J0XWB8_9TREE|nr:putative cytosine-purine permease [Cutaneotrichosporon oleaginosum]KLT45343.1 putative cytosine-purine permease [Cutaneotrichosporon oleaginosum]TXT14830.1 hypothetical protein COLE_01023 [Cutaneotrichosporon oleaginosum]